MKRIALAIFLALTIATPVLAARGGIHGKPQPPVILGLASCAAPCIVAPDDATFGSTFGIDFAAADLAQDYWARADCYANATSVTTDVTWEGHLYAEYAYLGDRPEVWNDEFFTAGPTPSWAGGGGDCTVVLGWWLDGADWQPVASDDFVILP